MNPLEKEIAERFKRDTARHAMTVLHDDGLYRHLRFRAPNSSFYWFDIVTWPGSLAVRGDVGAGYIFSRVEDMFTFFRRNGNQRGINPGYWAEKLSDGGRSVREHSEDVLKAKLVPWLADYEKEYPDLVSEYESAKARYDAARPMQRWPYGGIKEPSEPKQLAEIRQLIADYEDDDRLRFPDGASELLGELEGFGVVSDTWEWNLSDWSWEYLWACHAIVWGIAQYDAANKPAVETLVPAGEVL